MPQFEIDITWNDPYPKMFRYRTEGSTIGLGVYRALKQFRKENKGRRIKNLNLVVKQYARTEKVV